MAYIVNTITNKIGTPNIRARVTEPYTGFSPVNYFPPNSIKINARQIFIVANVTIISGISKNVMISPFTVPSATPIKIAINKIRKLLASAWIM